MHCPKCNDEMDEVSVKGCPGLKVDHCRKCSGYWFDIFELSNLTDRKVATLQVDHLTNCQDSSFKCPKCSGRVVNGEWANYGVTVDFCTECNGTWFDAGELDMILATIKYD